MVKSVFSQAGYLFNDNRAAGEGLQESDLLGCKHCQALIDKAKWKEAGAFCHICDGPICAYCDKRTPQYGCENFARRIEQSVERDYRRQQNAKILGL